MLSILLMYTTHSSQAADNQQVLTLHGLQQLPASQIQKLEPEVLDYRYAPESSQACLGLPDDPHKTILGSNGGLHYEYSRQGPEEYTLGAGVFGTRILAELEAPGIAGSKRQTLHHARVPIVTTRHQQGTLELEQIAWANTPSGQTVDEWSAQRADFLWLKVRNTGREPAAAKLRLHVGTNNRLQLDQARQRLVLNQTDPGDFCTFSRPCLPLAKSDDEPALIALDRSRISRNWSRPTVPCAPLFRNVLVSSRQLGFEFAAEKGRKYRVALGLVEGYYSEPGKRTMEILIEGNVAATVDMVGKYGQNTPLVLLYDAEDKNGDGKLSITLRAAADTRDKNVALSGLWIYPAETAPKPEEILIGKTAVSPLEFADADHLPGTVRPLVLNWETGTLAPGQQFELLVTVPLGEGARKNHAAPRAQAELDRALQFWQAAPLPYDRIQIADPAVQALLDGCIRNIYQAREIKNGLPAFQVGPTMYRGLWVVDGSFLMEAATILGRAAEARQGIDYLLSFQKADGGFEIISTHWKETGIVLWAVNQQARLTGDKAWLAALWPKLEKCWAYIRQLRQQASTDPAALHAGLIAPGMSDGGLHGPAPEYTNIYWTLAGMRAAIEGARWLGKNDQAAAWQKEWDDFMAAFRRAAERDLRDDGHGHRCLPITMNSPANIPVQKAQWAFLHAVYPGQIFGADDPLVRGNMAMLLANDRQGLVYDTGWLEQGLWTYFGSFYGHAWLWLGEGRKAAATLYAFGNHASPLMCWREEQMPAGVNRKGLKRAYVGDMPHNWASAEFIRLVRHLLVLERNQELHLLEGLPQAWTRPGAENHLRETPTQFGPLTLTLRVSQNGQQADLELTPPQREPPAKIVLHLEPFGRAIAQVQLNGKPITGDTLEIPRDQKARVTLVFK
jgi:hypothetical protein